jgi:hypothetical protein
MDDPATFFFYRLDAETQRKACFLHFFLIASASAVNIYFQILFLHQRLTKGEGNILSPV